MTSNGVTGERARMTDRRIAVVGCGGAGQMHVDALARAGLAPAALIDPDPGRRATMGRPWPDAVLAATPDHAAGAFDAAIVAVPDVVHAPLAIELLHAGIDVLVEKPMAGTRADALAMAAAADATGRLLAVAQVRRHLAVLTWASTVLRAGVLGAVERVDAAQGGRDDWVAASAGYVDQAVGGVIADQGAHSIDLLAWWFGPLAVVSCTDDARGGEEADAAIDLLAGAIPVHLDLSRIRSLRNTVRVHTERGLLEVALDHYQPRALLAVPDDLGIEPFTPVDDDLAAQFDRQLPVFLDALDGRSSPLLATAADGVVVAGVIEDCYAGRTSQEPWWMRSAVTGA